MDHTHNGKPADYSAPPEFAADLLARQVPVLQQQILQLQIEVAHRDHLLAQKDAEIAALKSASFDPPDSTETITDEVFSS